MLNSFYLTKARNPLQLRRKKKGSRMNPNKLAGFFGLLLTVFSCSQDTDENKGGKPTTQRDEVGLISAVEQMQSTRPPAPFLPVEKASAA